MEALYRGLYEPRMESHYRSCFHSCRLKSSMDYMNSCHVILDCIQAAIYLAAPFPIIVLLGALPTMSVIELQTKSCLIRQPL
ncbi:hypothetical protein GDO78_015283 [Eleutherodactylus coqui]|uniref:Uncharacterized protein n=1 Tax=Eleutherodactylus coqui TaxID=57060 RepID=A0A8J6E6F9_ELECQ|nr:hypothetical protein GDO78_015283 [Eleutherodactylus coqui]